MPLDPEIAAAAAAVITRLEEATTEAHQAAKDLDAAIARGKDEMRSLAKDLARRYLAKAMETAATVLRGH